MAEMPTDTVGHPVPDPVSVPQACRGHGPSGMLGRGDGAGGAVHTGVQEGERGWGLLAAQSSGGVGHGAEPMFGGDPRQGRPQPDVTCVELGAVDRSHHRVQLPACGQGEPVRPGAPSLWCSPHPPAGLQGATAPIPGQLQGVGCLGGGLHPHTGQGAATLPSAQGCGRILLQELSGSLAAREHRCPGMPLPAAAPALLVLAITVGVGVGSLLVRHDPGRGVVHLRRERTGAQRLRAVGLVRPRSKARSATLGACCCCFRCRSKGCWPCEETWEESLPAAAPP